MADALARRGYAVAPVVIPQTPTAEEAAAFTRRELERLRPDAVFIALHGAFGEDGGVQTVCEQLHLAYTGSTAQASRLGMDKAAAKRRLAEAGLAVPRGQVLDAARHGPLLDRLSYPCVVKPLGGGSSLGVSLVRSEPQLREALEAARAYGSRVLVEEFIPGRELTVGVVGEEALPVVEVRPHRAFFDYAAKYTAGLTDYLVPAPLTPAVAEAVQAAGLRAHQALGCRHLSRTDIILRDEQVPVVLEVNTIPGFTPTSLLPKAAACVQLSYDALCEQLVLMAVHDLAPKAA